MQQEILTEAEKALLHYSSFELHCSITYFIPNAAEPLQIPINI